MHPHYRSQNQYNGHGIDDEVSLLASKSGPLPTWHSPVSRNRQMNIHSSSQRILQANQAYPSPYVTPLTKPGSPAMLRGNNQSQTRPFQSRFSPLVEKKTSPVSPSPSTRPKIVFSYGNQSASRKTMLRKTSLENIVCDYQVRMPEMSAN